MWNFLFAVPWKIMLLIQRGWFLFAILLWHPHSSHCVRIVLTINGTRAQTGAKPKPIQKSQKLPHKTQCLSLSPPRQMWHSGLPLFPLSLDGSRTHSHTHADVLPEGGGPRGGRGLTITGIVIRRSFVCICKPSTSKSSRRTHRRHTVTERGGHNCLCECVLLVFSVI